MGRIRARRFRLSRCQSSDTPSSGSVATEHLHVVLGPHDLQQPPTWDLTGQRPVIKTTVIAIQ